MFKHAELKTGFVPSRSLFRAMLCLGVLLTAQIFYTQEKNRDVEIKPSSAAEWIQLAEKFLNTSPEKALTYADQALSLARGKSDKAAEGNACLQIGLAQRNLKNYEQSLNYLQQALDIFETVGDGMKVAAVLSAMSQVYRIVEENDKALECLQKALKLREEVNDQKGIANTLISIVDIEIKLKNFSRASGYLERAQKIGQELKSRDLLRDIFFAFSQMHAGRGDFRSAFQYYQQYAQMREEILVAQANFKIANIQTQNTLAKKESEIALVQKEERIAGLILKRKRILKISLLCGTLLLLLALSALLIQKVHWQRQIAEIRGETDKKEKELQSVSLRLKDLTKADDLTGVANRRFFTSWLEREWRHLQRNSSPLSVILVDIDFFKLYNEAHGRLAGDECLKSVAKVLWDNSRRAADLVGRYGGEEFIVIMPSTPLDGALQVAERMRRAVEDLRIPHEKSACSDVVTISLGAAAAVPQKGSGYEELVAAAGQALLKCKEGGRNRAAAAAAITRATGDKGQLKGPKKDRNREDR